MRGYPNLQQKAVRIKNKFHKVTSLDDPTENNSRADGTAKPSVQDRGVCQVAIPADLHSFQGGWQQRAHRAQSPSQALPQTLTGLNGYKDTLLILYPSLTQISLVSCASDPGSGVLLASTGLGLLEDGGPPALGGGGAPFTFALGAKSSSLLFASPSLNISSNALFPLATFGFRGVRPGSFPVEVCGGGALGGGKSIAAGTKKSPTGFAGDAAR